MLDTDSEDDEESTQGCNHSRRIYTFEEYNGEIDTLRRDYSTLNVRNPIQFRPESEVVPEPVEQNLDLLELEIGGTTIPRYSCACHKLNLVVREAIAENEEFKNYIRYM